MVVSAEHLSLFDPPPSEIESGPSHLLRSSSVGVAAVQLADSRSLGATSVGLPFGPLGLLRRNEQRREEACGGRCHSRQGDHASAFAELNCCIEMAVFSLLRARRYVKALTREENPT